MIEKVINKEMNGEKMIKNIAKHIHNNKILPDDIKYIWKLNDRSEFMELEKFISKQDTGNILLESNIYYPLIYQIEDNCPNCGYRTPLAKQKYSEEFIIKNIEYKLKDLNCYPISGINCYNKDISGLRELHIILNILEKYDLNINVAVSNYENLKDLSKYNLNSIIYLPPKIQNHKFNENNGELNEKYEKKVIKYIHETMHLKVTYLLTLNYNETHNDVFDIIMKMKKLNVDSIELRGFDPFIDSPEEYNPQYSKEYLIKFIILLKLYLPKTELKIQYATNNLNYFEEYLKLGINIITGIYTKNMNSKLENINEIVKIIKK